MREWLEGEREGGREEREIVGKERGEEERRETGRRDKEIEQGREEQKVNRSELGLHLHVNVHVHVQCTCLARRTLQARILPEAALLEKKGVVFGRSCFTLPCLVD